ncbi:hypothetical protein CPB83DRAFT_897039 [Crepidotus variabilis]|uniref:Uncharacterized protein n=1 Tax=Crepidotus variabilis TaxID=179855 RepID=A0A9P6JM64_9AGAR|nr:hypothetical protein CPB83DRAFT_897039 [Crepidotus variabilis]
MNSSPLAESPGKSSPVLAAQARRKSQYKTLSPMTPLSVRSTSGGRQLSHRSVSEGTKKAGTSASGSGGDDALRERFRAKCIERAVREREKAIRGKRSLMPRQPSSDDYAMEDDDSEDDEAIMQDELFRRIVANAERKEKHAYRLSYAREVGSSFDPDLEEVDRLEQEFTAPDTMRSRSVSVPLAGPSTAASGPPSSVHPEDEEDIPLDFEDLNDEQLQAYAEELASREEFDDIPEDFHWSDFDDVEDLGNPIEDPKTPVPHNTMEDDMDVS